MADIKTFEIGKTYTMFSACDVRCVWSYKVIDRKNTTITLQAEDGEIIRKRVKVFMGEEHVRPLGAYSMSPILTAGRVKA